MKLKFRNFFDTVVLLKIQGNCNIRAISTSLYSYTNYGKKVLTVMANNSTIQQIELYQLSVQLTEHKIDHDI